jgi:hypothetical protein
MELLVLINLKTTPSTVKKSYWMYMEEGCFKFQLLLKQHLKKGDRIAFVEMLLVHYKEYFAPEDGVIIVVSTNPANMSGGRIIHCLN